MPLVKGYQIASTPHFCLEFYTFQVLSHTFSHFIVTSTLQSWQGTNYYLLQIWQLETGRGNYILRVAHLVSGKVDLESESSDSDFYSLGSLTIYRDNVQTRATLTGFSRIMPGNSALSLTTCHTSPRPPSEAPCSPTFLCPHS